MLQLSRYVHLNPVQTRARKKKPLKERRAYICKYRWSSYPAYIGRVKPEDFVDYSLCWDMVDATGRQHTKSYRRFVEDGLDRHDEELEEARSWSPVAIGSEVFVRTIEAMHDIKSREANKPENVLNRQTRPLFDPTVNF